MTKAQRGNKESKKAPALSLKEKRAAKKSRQDAKSRPQPFITPRAVP